MNGRVYDPVLGRFLQADPFVQAPYDLQSYNRYSYVMNNPLGLTDPSGFSWWKDNGQGAFRAIGAIVAAVVIGPMVTGLLETAAWDVAATSAIAP
jgi:hypothetical protein